MCVVLFFLTDVYFHFYLVLAWEFWGLFTVMDEQSENHYLGLYWEKYNVTSMVDTSVLKLMLYLFSCFIFGNMKSMFLNSPN